MEKSKRKIAETTGFLTFALILLLSSCSSRNNLPKWMLGKWSVKFPDYSVQETWKEKDEKFAGEALWNGNFKSWKENLTLFVNENNKLVYCTIVDGKSTSFVCEDMNSDTLLFINNANEFPKRLHYAKASGNKMEVWIDNTDDDPNRIDFHFQKIR